MIRVMIAEDHDILREGLQSLLKDETSIKIVAEAPNGKILLDYLETTPADVILMDINMPVLNGVDTTRIISEQHKNIKVLVLSMLDHPNYLSQMLSVGAKGYILKNSSKAELIKAIHEVAAGRKYISKEIAGKLESSNSKSEDAKKVEVHLTKRELQILELLAEGLTNKEIGDRIFLSKRTVETHRRNLFEKTNCKNSSALIKYAIVKGILKDIAIEKFS
jgi:DNA-binding NarL/FixJ family response regulator